MILYGNFNTRKGATSKNKSSYWNPIYKKRLIEKRSSGQKNAKNSYAFMKSYGKMIFDEFIKRTEPCDLNPFQKFILKTF